MGLKSQDQQGPLKPYYTKLVTVKEAEDASGTKPFDNSKFADDLAVDMKLDIGKDFDTDMRVSGQLEWEEVSTPDGKKKRVAGWGPTGWIVDNFFQTLGIKFGEDGIPEVDVDDPRVPAEAIEQLVGKQFVQLRYAYGHKRSKPDQVGFTIYNKVTVPNEGELVADAEDRLVEIFLQDVSKGYPKDYDPSVVTNGQQEEEVEYADPSDKPPF